MPKTAKRELVCITCPRGCVLSITLSSQGQPVSVEGNLCPRGRTYAETEITYPVRTLTTTVLCESGRPLPVKTASPIPKELLLPAMQEIRHVVASEETRIGDVLLRDILGTGVDLVATANAE